MLAKDAYKTVYADVKKQEVIAVRKLKTVLYIAASLDGYIAAEDESLDWLLNVEGDGDNGFSKFYDTVDTILMGRKTYDWIMEHEGQDFPYKGKECYVFSKARQESSKNVTFINSDPAEFAESIKNKRGKNIWLVGGGILIDAFFKQKAVDTIIINIAPIILGSGIPLFHDSDLQTRLSLKKIRRYNQFAELHYEVLTDQVKDKIKSVEI